MPAADFETAPTPADCSSRRADHGPLLAAFAEWKTIFGPTELITLWLPGIVVVTWLSILCMLVSDLGLDL